MVGEKGLEPSQLALLVPKTNQCPRNDCSQYYPFLLCNILSSMQHLSQQICNPVLLLKLVLLVRLTRLELVPLARPVPKTGVSANSTIGAELVV